MRARRTIASQQIRLNIGMQCLLWVTHLIRTSIKVSKDTHKMVVNARGSFEQLFKRNLSLDQTIYLSARLISFVYEKVQKLNALDKIKILQTENGSVHLEGADTIFSEILPELVKEFTEINSKLAEKEGTVQLASLTE